MIFADVEYDWDPTLCCPLCPHVLIMCPYFAQIMIKTLQLGYRNNNPVAKEFEKA
jgi:hypothetical protein